MENIIRNYKEQFQNNHRQRRKYACLLGVLALLVCLAVFWRLKLVGTAMTNEASCGLQEHTHTEDCYTDVLVCGYDDAAVAAGEHEHTDACYEHQLICALPEHTHTADCYSDTDADTETEATWMASYPQGALTGDWAQDTVMIAASQMNYTESTRNWQLAEDGTRRGYTRYGAWYGNPYGDWNGMFAAFCLHYAGVDERYLTTANAAGANSWSVALYQAGQLQGPGHTAMPGDVVFLGNDSTVESCAIVMDNDGTQLTLAAGDVNNTVTELTIPADSASILGYAATADAYAAYEAAHQPTPTPEEPATAEEPTQDERPKTEESGESENQAVTLEQQPEQPQIDTLEGDTEVAVPMDPYINSVTAESTVYDADKKLYKTILDMNFTISTADARNTKNLYYELPDGISIPQEEVGKEFIGKSGNADAYTFKIIRDEETGRYKLELTFLDDFLDNHNSETIKSQLYYEAQIGQDKVESTGEIKVIFKDGVELVINPKDISYNDDESPSYDINTTKKGSFDADTKKIRYEVTVSTVKGTPDTITVKDVLDNVYNYGISDVNIVSVTKNENGAPTATITEGDGSGHYQLVLDNSESGKKSFTMTLPGLQKAADGKTPKTYTIVYEYTVPDDFGDRYLPNTVTASSKNTVTNETVTKTANANVHVYKNLLKKNGNYSNNTVTWTITVNESRNSNLVGKTLRDTMFSTGVDGEMLDNQHIKPEDITVRIKDADGKDATGGYTIVTDENGNVSDIRFDSVTADNENYYKYEFKYSVPVTPGITSSTMTNTAEIGGEKKSDSVTVKPASGGSGTNSPLYKGRTSATTLNPDGTATINWEFKITAPAVIPQGTDVYDELVLTTTDAKHYFTLGQAQDIVTALTSIKDVDGSAIVDAGTIKFNLRAKNMTSASNSALSNARYVSLSDIQNDESLLDGNMLTGFTFKTAKQLDAGKSFGITYSSTANMADVSGSDVKFTNFTKYGDYESTASQNYVKPYVKKNGLWNIVYMTANNRKDTAVIWKVTVGYDRNDASTTKYVIQDTLPAGMELKEIWLGTGEGYDSANANNQKWAYDVDGNTFKKNTDGSTDSAKLEFTAQVTKNEQGQSVVTVTVDFSSYRANFDKFFVDFACGITQQEFDSVAKGEASWNKEYTNNVTLCKENGSEIGKASNKQTINIDRQSEKVKPVEKSGAWDENAKTIAYTLKINPEGKQYPTTESQLLLRDEFAYDNKGGNARAHLVDNSVKLYRAIPNESGELVQGNPVEDWSWTYSVENGNCVLQVSIPNATPLILIYQYKLDYAGKDSVSIWTQNTATLNGMYESQGSDTGVREWKKSTGGGTVQNSYDFVKVDSRDNNLRLTGAEFALFAYDATSDDYLDTGKRYSTDENGKFSISIDDEWGEGSSYQKDTPYYVVETKAPDKYILPPESERTKYYFYFGGSNTAALPQDFLAKAPIDLNKFSDTVYVSNTKLSQDVVIVKQWQTAAGEPLPDEQKQSVTITLSRVAVEKALWEKWQDGTATEAELSTAKENAVQSNSATQNAEDGWPKVFELNAENHWQREFRSLDVEADDGLYYIYFVEETHVPGFTAEVTETRTSDAGKLLYKTNVQITNTYRSAYELPKTGGRGTMGYVAGGAALMAVSLLCGYFKKRKKDEGRQNG